MEDPLKEAEEGERNIHTGNHEKAFNIFLRLTEREPHEPFFWWRLGSIVGHYQERWLDSLPYFQQAISLDEDCAPAWGGLGSAYLHLGEWDKAEQALRKKLALKETAHHYVFLAVALHAIGQYQEAVESCKRALEIRPNYEEAYLNLGLALLKLSKKEEA